MTIQKKSLISSLNTTKKAIVASSTTPANPSVNAPVSARVAGPMRGRVAASAKGRVSPGLRPCRPGLKGRVSSGLKGRKRIA